MPVIFLEGFVGRLFREFGVVIAGAVINFCLRVAYAYTYAECKTGYTKIQTGKAAFILLPNLSLKRWLKGYTDSLVIF